MKYLCIITSIVLAIQFFLKTKRIYNPGTLFLGYWSIITFLASLRLDNAPAIQQTTYAFILMGLVSFGVGCFCCLFTHHKVKNNMIYDMKIKDYKLLNIACVIIIIYSVYRLGIIASYLSRGFSWGSIRLMHGVAGVSGEGTLKGGNWSQFIHDDFVAPCVYLIAPVFAVELFLGNRNKQFLILALTSITLYSISSVSRAVWGFLILYFIVILLMFFKENKVSYKVKKWLKRIPLFAALLFVVIIIITKARSETSEANLLYNMLAYLSGGITLFDLHLNEPIADIRTYGFFSLYGFLYPVFFVLNYLGIKFPPVFGDINYIKQQLEIFVPISDHVTMNAYSTLFFNFYNDFGLFGIFLGSFLFGYFCMLSYMYFIKKKNMRTLVCYLILIQFMIFSMARIYTIYTTRALSLIWLLILLPKDDGIKIKLKK